MKTVHYQYEATRPIGIRIAFALCDWGFAALSRGKVLTQLRHEVTCEKCRQGLLLRCSKHPRYKALRKPRSCRICKELFRLAVVERALTAETRKPPR